MNVLHMYIRWIGPSVPADGILDGRHRKAKAGRDSEIGEKSPYSPCLINRNLVNRSSGLANH